MTEQTQDRVVIQVDFSVPRQVRDILEEDAKTDGLTVERHAQNLLRPLVPNLLCALAGYPDRDAA